MTPEVPMPALDPVVERRRAFMRRVGTYPADAQAAIADLSSSLLEPDIMDRLRTNLAERDATAQMLRETGVPSADVIRVFFFLGVLQPKRTEKG